MSVRVRVIRDDGTDVANRKRPPASIAGSGTRFSSGGGGMVTTGEGLFIWRCSCSLFDGDDDCSCVNDLVRSW